MSRFAIITLLAVIATTSAKPYVVTGYNEGYISLPNSDYDPHYSYPYTPVIYVETVPIAAIAGGPPRLATLPAPPSKLIAKNAPQVAAPRPPPPRRPAPPPPPAPSAQQELPIASPPPRRPPVLSAQQALPPPPQAPPAPPAAPAPPPAPAPANLITITKTFPDPTALLSSLPIAQLLELPPVKQIVALKTSKLEAIMGLKAALQGKLATIASLLP